MPSRSPPATSTGAFVHRHDDCTSLAVPAPVTWHAVDRAETIKTCMQAPFARVGEVEHVKTAERLTSNHAVANRHVKLAFTMIGHAQAGAITPGFKHALPIAGGVDGGGKNLQLCADDSGIGRVEWRVSVAVGGLVQNPHMT